MVGTVATVLGIIGISGVSAVRSSRRFSRHYRFFRFRRSEPVDFVLTTSAREKGGHGGVSYLRSVTAVGNLKGATEIAQAIGYGAGRRQLQITDSAELESPLAGDLVVIGLPGKNEASRVVIERLRKRYPEARLCVDESERDGCRLSLGTFSEGFVVEEQMESHIPRRDLALIVLWVNPLTVRKRRLILCAGFTSYGTAAAADYLINEILNTRLGALRKKHPELPSLWSRKWICFAMVVEATLINDQVVELCERELVPLEDPGCPPFEASEAQSAGDERDRPLSAQQPVGDGAAPSDEPVPLREG